MVDVIQFYHHSPGNRSFLFVLVVFIVVTSWDFELSSKHKVIGWITV